MAFSLARLSWPAEDGEVAPWLASSSSSLSSAAVPTYGWIVNMHHWWKSAATGYLLRSMTLMDIGLHRRVKRRAEEAVSAEWVRPQPFDEGGPFRRSGSR